jgi:hypothetical protein
MHYGVGMKEIWLILLILLGVGISTAEVPDIVGKWTGTVNEYVAEDGSYKFLENGSINLAIIEQKDRLFTGNITYTRNETEIVEGFAGAIGLDNKTLYIAEFKEGYDLGTIISDNEIELVYLADGKIGTAAIDMFHRIEPKEVAQDETVAQEAKEWLANELGVDVGLAKVIEFTQETWGDSCLGLPGPDEFCSMMMVPGYKVICYVEGKEYEVRIGENGAIRVVEL